MYSKICHALSIFSSVSLISLGIVGFTTYKYISNEETQNKIKGYLIEQIKEELLPSMMPKIPVLPKQTGVGFPINHRIEYCKCIDQFEVKWGESFRETF